MIKGIFIINNHGKVRLMQFYNKVVGSLLIVRTRKYIRVRVHIFETMYSQREVQSSYLVAILSIPSSMVDPVADTKNLYLHRR